MLQMTREQHERYIAAIGPWHYNYQFADGCMTGDSAPNLFPEKMPLMIAGGAFSKPNYPDVLDLGANSGYIAKWFTEAKNSHVVAVEAGEKFWLQLKHAVECFGLESRIEPRNEHIELCQFALNTEDTYDLVIFLGTMHHIGRAHHEKIFHACRKVLKPGGEFVVQTKREEDVMAKLMAAGFQGVYQVYWSDQQDRGCWAGVK